MNTRNNYACLEGCSSRLEWPTRKLDTAIFRPYVQLTKLPRASLLPCAGETCIAQVWQTREWRDVSLRTGR